MNQKYFENKIASLSEACCGCGACAARCPKGCIAMEPDACGFPRPVIDVDTCVGCGGCDAVCPVLNQPSEDVVEKALWAKADDADLLDRSSSGGVFGLLARDAISRGGVVSGAGWADGCRELRHVVIDHADDLDSLMRSKYVQSSVGCEVYEGVRDALLAGLPVLFSGTACQVAGMRSYLGALAESDLFLGVDVICHGVPSPELWRRWLGHVEEREGGEVQFVNFRSKTTGWSSYSVMYEFITEEDDAPRCSLIGFSDDWYMRAFLNNASLRGSCLSCPFKRRCGSDLTIGDFWGVQRQHSGVSVEGGVSAVLVNTEKGSGAVGNIAANFSSAESTFKKVATGNPSLVRCVAPHPDRGTFQRAIADGMPVADMMRLWDFEPPLCRKTVFLVKRSVKRLLRRR